MSQSSLDSTSSALTLTPNAPEVLHFAYASSPAALLSIAPASLPVGLAYLPGFTFTLSPAGQANVVPVQQKSSPSLLTVPGREDAAGKGAEGVEAVREEGVYGLLYLVPEADEPRLDDAQGAYRKTIRAVELFPADFPEVEGGDAVSVRVVRALVYLDAEAGEPGTPGKEHIKDVNDAVAGAIEWGMPAWYVDRVRRFIPLDEAEEEQAEETKGKGKEKA